MTEDDLSTVLSSGEEVPVRRVGEMFIVSYDFLPVEEFLLYVDRLLADEGLPNDYDADDIDWVEGVLIDFGEDDGVARIKLNALGDPDAIDATVLECW